MDPNRPADPLDIDDERDVSEDEREQILGQIERAIQAERKPLEEELAGLRPRRKGRLFPLVVNVAAAALVVAGAFLLSEFFEVRGQSITLRSAGLTSAEGSLLEALRRESQGLIRDKEAQIAAIENRLQAMDEQTLELKARIQSDLKVREEELRRRVEAEVGAERDRLEAAGTSAPAIDRRLRELEAQREAALSGELERYRRDLEGALQQKEQELADSRRELQGALAAATSERVRLAAELTQREADLRSRFDRERESLEREASAAEQRLAALQEAQLQERALVDQLQGYYRDALQGVAGDDLAGAAEALGRLNRLLDSPALVRVPALVERRALDRALSGALEELIALREAPAQPPGSGGAGQGERIAELELRSAELELRSAELANAARERAQLELRSAELERWRTRVDVLSGRYAEVRARVRGLIAQGGEAKLREAERLLLETLRDSTAESILPGMAQHLEQVDQPGGRLHEDAGEQKGREAALTEVLRYLNSVSRGTGSPEQEARIMAQARTDPLYRAVIREIQVLRAGGGAPGEVTAPYLLLGTVASVSGYEVVIEPLGDVRVTPGATVLVRRSDLLGQETLAARGIVEQIRGGRIYARMEAPAAAGPSPESRDLVYIEP